MATELLQQRVGALREAVVHKKVTLEVRLTAGTVQSPHVSVHGTLHEA